MGRGLGVGLTLGVAVGIGVAVGVGVSVAVAGGVGVGVGVGVGPDCAQYLPPVLRAPLLSSPPQTIIPRRSTLPCETSDHRGRQFAYFGIPKVTDLEAMKDSKN